MSNPKYVTANRDGLGDQDYALVMVEMNISIVDRIVHIAVDVVNRNTYERFRTAMGIHEPDFTNIMNANLNGVFKTEIPTKFWNWLSQPEQDMQRSMIVLGREPVDQEVIPMWTDTPPA